MKSGESIRSVARETLERFSREVGGVQPPVPIERLAEWLGFRVIPLESVPSNLSAVVSTREMLIGINAGHSHHRQRFSIAHEIGHIVLKHRPESECTASEIALCNREADLCASELLMPTHVFLVARGRTQSRDVLARIFDVSAEALERKLFALKGNPEVLATAAHTTDTGSPSDPIPITG